MCRGAAVVFGVAASLMAAQARAATLFKFGIYDQRKSFNTDVTWTRNPTTNTGGVITSTDQGGHGKTPSPVSFTFVDPAAGAIYNVGLLAVLNLSAYVASPTPAYVQNGFDVQPGVYGTFSFIYQGGAPVPGQAHQSKTYGVGPGAITLTNGEVLLTGTFTGAKIVGAGALGDLIDSTKSGGTISYSSPLLALQNDPAEAFDFSLTAVTPAFGINKPGRALNSFSANSTGAFYTAVPEPASWVLSLMGFGLMGAALRRRRKALTAGICA